MSTSSPARLYCTVVGAALVIAGVIGFFYSSGFETGAAGVAKDSDEMFGILAVNGWLNLLHILLGILALVAAGSPNGARHYCLGIGLLLVLLGIWGLIDSDGVILGLLPLNDGDNVLYMLLGLTGLAAGSATPKTAAPTPSRTA
jgi:hypothetical protein